MSVTPLRLALKSLIWAFRDSACALVLLLLKKFKMLSQWLIIESATDWKYSFPDSCTLCIHFMSSLPASVLSVPS